MEKRGCSGLFGLLALRFGRQFPLISFPIFTSFFLSTQVAEGELGTIPSVVEKVHGTLCWPSLPLCETKRVVTSLARSDQSISGKLAKLNFKNRNAPVQIRLARRWRETGTTG